LGDAGIPRLTPDRVISVLRRGGFECIRCAGSHQKWRNSATGKQVIVAYHRGKIIPIGTMKAIIDGSGISLERWRE